MGRFIAWIPARGGSKRLPGKNVLDFCGHPLIYYSIDIARRCRFIDEVYVSTDDETIAKVSMACGARVVERPRDFASDTATTGSAAKHLLEALEIKGSKDLTGLITLQPTQPLRSIELMNRCIQEFEKNAGEFDSLVTVSLNKHKIGKIQGHAFKPMNYNPEQRSQDLEPTYFENGVVYISKPELVLQHGTVFDANARAVVVEDIFSRIDIDDKLDFDIAQFIFENNKGLYA